MTPWITSHGLAAQRAGQGPCLLLIPGLGGRGAFWAGQATRLSTHRQVVTFDHRSVGGSAAQTRALTIADHAADAIDLLDDLGVARADVVGHSMGGAIAQHLALHWPDRIRRLVLSSTWGGPHQHFADLFALRLAILRAAGAEAYLRQGLIQGFPPDWLGARSGEVPAMITERLVHFPGAAIEETRIAAILAHDLSKVLPKLTRPTLVMACRDDGIVPVDASRALARLIPHAKLWEQDWGGHFAPVTLADDYGAALNDFLGPYEREGD